ncbi:MAG: ATP-binding protein [Lentimicrobiaceae bacterium]|nr:ATP-binding protein [Lentimicrobiaceae bacterium]
MVNRIAITGPESTGKSQLTQELAAYYNTVFVPEYARKYLGLINRAYEEKDILKIAQGQLQLETSLIASARNFIFCDTDFLVTTIWSEVKYGRCHPWIQNKLVNHRYNLYLLCNIDLPWEEDPMREHPHKRDFLFEKYLTYLKKMQFPFAVVSGKGKERLKNAAYYIDHAFLNV